MVTLLCSCHRFAHHNVQKINAEKMFDAYPVKKLREMFKHYHAHFYLADDKRFVLFMGDGAMTQYAVRIQHFIENFPNQHFSALFVHRHGILPIPQVYDGQHIQHEHFMTDMKNFISSLHDKIYAVVFVASWENFDTAYFLFQNDHIPLSTNVGYQLTIESFENFIQWIQQYGIRVNIIKNMSCRAKEHCSTEIEKHDSQRIHRSLDDVCFRTGACCFSSQLTLLDDVMLKIMRVPFYHNNKKIG